MSVWLRIHDKDGKVHYVSAPFDPLCVVTGIGLGVVLLVSWLVMFRAAVISSPGGTSVACISILVAGLALFVLAKISVIRTGHLVSFGPGRMSRMMRFVYRLGYTLMAVGAIAALLFFLVATCAA